MALESNSIPLTTADDLRSLAEYFGVPETNEGGVTIFFPEILAQNIRESIEHAIRVTIKANAPSGLGLGDKAIQEAHIRDVCELNWAKKMRSIRSRFTRMSPGGRDLALKYLNQITRGELDLLGDPVLGEILDMQYSNLAQHEDSGLHPVSGIMNDGRFKEFFKMGMTRWDIEKENQEQERREVSEELFLVFIDLDNFKAVNDSVNYEAGDFVLRTFGHYLKTYADSRRGYAAHWGGDEYVIFAPTEGSAEEFPKNWETYLAGAIDKEYDGDTISEEDRATLKAVTVSLGGVKLEAANVQALKNNFDEAYADLKAQAAALMKADKKERKMGR
jgi:diguanylate cyclase (GGDEF)-like protein